MEEKLVSIIMPVYNSEKYIENAIESVLNQTYNNIELIAVDDGSRDNSLNILKKFSKKDDRIKVFSKENGGISSTRNYGLKQAKGEYIAFIDNDDEYDKNLIRDNLKLIVDNNADIVKFNKVKRIIGKKIYCESVKFDFKDTLIFEKDNIWKNFDVIYKYGGTIWNAIYNRDFLIKNDIKFDETQKNVIEDHRFNLECYKYLSKIVLNPKEYYYWNMRIGHSTTGKFINERFEDMKIEANNLYTFLINKDIEKFNKNFWITIKNNYLFNILLVMNYKNSNFNAITIKKYLINLKKYDVFKRKCSKDDYKYLKKNKIKIKYYTNRLGLELFDNNLYLLLILISSIKFKYDIKFRNKRF